MIVRGARVVPVLFSYAPLEARTEGWGRFARLSAKDAELLTYFKLRRGDRLVLSFSLLEEPFDGVHAEVARAGVDSDGYHIARLRFLDPGSRLRLGRTLREFLSRREGGVPGSALPNLI